MLDSASVLEDLLGNGQRSVLALGSNPGYLVLVIILTQWEALTHTTEAQGDLGRSLETPPSEARRIESLRH